MKLLYTAPLWGWLAFAAPPAAAERREWPVLAGQRPLYLYKMLLDFKAGRVGGGEAATMAAMASTLDAADMADIAAWLGGLPRPAPAHESTAPPALRSLPRRGRPGLGSAARHHRPEPRLFRRRPDPLQGGRPRQRHQPRHGRGRPRTHRRRNPGAGRLFQPLNPFPNTGAPP